MPTPAVAAAALTIVCIGDSGTTAAHGQSPAELWPHRLQAFLPSTGYTVHALGVPDASVTRSAEHSYWDSDEWVQAQELKPDIAVVMLGMTDTKKINWAERDFLADLHEFVEDAKKLRGIGGATKVLLVTPPQHALASDVESEYDAAAMAMRMPVIVRHVATETDVVHVDVNLLFKGEAGRAGHACQAENDCGDDWSLFVDGTTHPSAHGHALIARAVAAEVRQDYNIMQRDWREFLDGYSPPPPATLPTGSASPDGDRMELGSFVWTKEDGPPLGGGKSEL